MPIEAWLLALLSAFLFGSGFVLTQFGLRHTSPALGAAVSMPTAALLFWALSPFFADFTGWQLRAGLLFAAVGLFFPAAITILTFEANRLMGPYVAGALGNLAPVFAVVAGVFFLGETLAAVQWAAVAAIIAGIYLFSLQRRWGQTDWKLWLIVLPLGAALCRGLGPPALKIGLEWWANPYVATMLCYASSATVAISAGVLRTGRGRRRVPFAAVRCFAGVGLCNGLAVLSWIEALALGPVSLISPVVAGYPVFILLLGVLFLGRQNVGAAQIAGVLFTVAGVVALIAA